MFQRSLILTLWVHAYVICMFHHSRSVELVIIMYYYVLLLLLLLCCEIATSCKQVYIMNKDKRPFIHSFIHSLIDIAITTTRIYGNS